MKVLIDLSPLRESRKFFTLWAPGLFVSVTAQAMQMAYAWRVFEDTGSSAAVGLIGLCVGLPVVVFSLFGGALTDTRNPKVVGIVGVSGQALACFVLLSLEIAGSLGLWAIYFCVFLSSSFGAVTGPSRRPYIRLLVRQDKIAAASSLFMFSMHGGQIFGPLLGGLLISGPYGYKAIFAAHLAALSLYFLSVAVLP